MRGQRTELPLLIEGEDPAIDLVARALFDEAVASSDEPQHWDWGERDTREACYESAQAAVGALERAGWLRSVNQFQTRTAVSAADGRQADG